MSFGELREASRRLARVPAGEGIRPGARVALLMPNGYQTCRLFIGAMYGGYCVTPLNLLAQPRNSPTCWNTATPKSSSSRPTRSSACNRPHPALARPPRMVVCDVDAAEFLP
jgi:long-chain acyl-CoA synthetase